VIAVAILIPWLALMLRGRIFPAAIWAVMVINNDNQERRHRELIKALGQK
jgi:hypothetical protein